MIVEQNFSKIFKSESGQWNFSPVKRQIKAMGLKETSQVYSCVEKVNGKTRLIIEVVEEG